jgi:outer membrane protein, multidrug efflux system
LTKGALLNIEVLDAQRSLFNAELARAQTKGVLFQALVNLYKAMGGGWTVETNEKSIHPDEERTAGMMEKHGLHSVE